MKHTLITLWEVYLERYTFSSKPEVDQGIQVFYIYFKDLEAELLSHRAALDKVSLDAISVNLKEDFNRVEQRWSCTLDRTSSMKQRIQLDITRWRNLAAQLEESAAWMSSREPKITEIESINLDTSVQYPF